MRRRCRWPRLHAGTQFLRGYWDYWWNYSIYQVMDDKVEHIRDYAIKELAKKGGEFAGKKALGMGAGMFARAAALFLGD